MKYSLGGCLVVSTALQNKDRPNIITPQTTGAAINNESTATEILKLAHYPYTMQDSNICQILSHGNT